MDTETVMETPLRGFSSRGQNGIHFVRLLFPINCKLIEPIDVYDMHRCELLMGIRNGHRKKATRDASLTDLLKHQALVLLLPFFGVHTVPFLDVKFRIFSEQSVENGVPAKPVWWGCYQQ